MSQKGFAQVLIFFLIIAVILGAGYYFYLKQTTTQTIQSSPTPTSTSHESTSSAETDNWKVFQDTRYTFQFKYPEKWTLDYQTDSLRSIILKDEQNKQIVSIDTGVNLTLMGISYCNANPQDTQRCEQNEIADRYVVMDWGVDGKASVLISKNDQSGIILTLHEVTPKTKIVFRKILSTFKFTDDSVTPTPQPLAISAAYKIVSSDYVSPDQKYVIGQIQMRDYITIEVARHNAGTANYITTDLVKENENVIGYGTKFRCQCDIFFKGWYANDKFIITILNALGEEYEYMVNISDSLSEAKIIEDSLRRIK